MNAEHIETLREMFAECANERRMKEADALDAAIAALSAEGGAPEWAVEWELRALDVPLSVGRTELTPGVHPRLPAHYQTRLNFGGAANPGNTVAFVFGNSSTERESRAMAEKLVAAYNAITPAQVHAEPAAAATGDMVLVPREATDDQIAAAIRITGEQGDFWLIYDAMIAAAQQEPSP